MEPGERLRIVERPSLHVGFAAHETRWFDCASHRA